MNRNNSAAALNTRKHIMTSPVVEGTPATTVGALVWFGIPLADWVLLCTLIYTLILILKQLPSVYKGGKNVIKVIRDFFTKS